MLRGLCTDKTLTYRWLLEVHEVLRAQIGGALIRHPTKRQGSRKDAFCRREGDTDREWWALWNKGIVCYNMGLTLREGDREYYYATLDRYFPGAKEKYMKRYGNAYELSSPNAEKLMKIFHEICSENGILSKPEECFRYLQEFPDKYPQMSLF